MNPPDPGGGGGWHKDSVSDCLPLAAPIGLWRGGGGWKRGSAIRGLDCGRFFLAQILAIYFHRKEGHLTTFQTPLDALILKMQSMYFFGFWPPCRSHAHRLHL